MAIIGAGAGALRPSVRLLWWSLLWVRSEASRSLGALRPAGDLQGGAEPPPPPPEGQDLDELLGQEIEEEQRYLIDVPPDWSQDIPADEPRLENLALAPNPENPDRDTMRLWLTAPERCNPCARGARMSVVACGRRVTFGSGPEKLWPGQTFVQFLPAPDPIVEPSKVVKSGEGYFAMKVKPPKCKRKGQYFRISLPVGVITKPVRTTAPVEYYYVHNHTEWELEQNIPKELRVDETELIPNPENPNVDTMRLTMTAPGRCRPCVRGERMRVEVCGGQKVELALEQDKLWAGAGLAAELPAPDPVVEPLGRVEREKGVYRFRARPPACKRHGQLFRVRLPGVGVVLRPMQASFFSLYAYDPRLDAEWNTRLVAERSSEGMRCCCSDLDEQCLWYPKHLLKSPSHSFDNKYHCPRVQKRGKEICTRFACIPFANDCWETHHGPDRCVPNRDPENEFQGKDCFWSDEELGVTRARSVVNPLTGRVRMESIKMRTTRLSS